MAHWEIVAWREIPAMVEVRDDAGQVTLPLSEKFQTLIDSLAMQLGMQDEAAYLEQWARLPGGAVAADEPRRPADDLNRGGAHRSVRRGRSASRRNSPRFRRRFTSSSYDWVRMMRSNCAR